MSDSDDPDESLQGENSECEPVEGDGESTPQQAASLWNRLDIEKYSRLSVPDPAPTTALPHDSSRPARGEDAVDNARKIQETDERRVSSGYEAGAQDLFTSHFDVLLDSSADSTAADTTAEDTTAEDTTAADITAEDIGLVTGRPAWLYSHLEASGSAGEGRAVSPGTGALTRDALTRERLTHERLRHERLRHERLTRENDIHGTLDERVASRWFALKRFLNPNDDGDDTPPARVVEAHVPCLAVFSLAGGVGKTSLVATLGRALSAHGERVLMVDTTSLGLLPFYFGSRGLKPGAKRTFTAAGSTDAAVSIVAIDPDFDPNSATGPDSHLATRPDRQPGRALYQPLDQHSALESEQAEHAGDPFVDEIKRHGRGSSRILVDLATSASGVTQRLLPLSPILLVPVAPDMNSVISLNAIVAFFRDTKTFAGRPIEPYYLINRFDPSLPLHLDVREVLRHQLGDRLLPFVLRQNPVVSDAVAQGMTVMDYAPNSTVAEDYLTLARWIRSVSAPAVPGYRGVRWTERPWSS